MTKEIRANRIIFEDENGNPRASLGLSSRSGFLTLMDENGKDRLTFVLLDHGTALDISEGKAKASLQVGKEGPSLWMIDENGFPRFRLVACDKEIPISVQDENKCIWRAMTSSSPP
jgi:hypothetical protein